MEAQSTRRTMLRVIQTAVSRILSPALLFVGGENALYMGHVAREEHATLARAFAPFAWRPSKPLLHLLLK